MKKKKKIYLLSFMFVVILFSIYAVVKSNSPRVIQKKKVDVMDVSGITASASMILTMEKEKAENNLLQEEPVMETPKASMKMTPIELYDSMSFAEKEAALMAGTLHMEYSGLYTYSGERLSVSKGAQYYNGHKETYYSQRVLPGNTLNIPGRHVADDGTVRDGDGFICVAADPGFKPKGSILITSLGPAKVYDSGCAYGVIDLYVNW